MHKKEIMRGGGGMSAGEKQEIFQGEKRKSVGLTGLPPVNFSRGVHKDQVQEAVEEKETQGSGEGEELQPSTY